MLGFFFLPELPNRFSDVMKSNQTMFATFFHAMLDAGIYLAPSVFEAGFISASHTDADIDETIRAARAAFDLVK